VRYLTGRLRSIGFALNGVCYLFRSQANARIHALATVLVVFTGFYFSISRTEWCLLALAMGAVWSAEALNTAVETVVNLVSPEHHALAGQAKDVAAAGVLLASVGAAVVGLLIFVPHLL